MFFQYISPVVVRQNCLLLGSTRFFKKPVCRKPSRAKRIKLAMPHHFLWIFLIFLDFSLHKKVCSPLSATKSRGVRGVNYLKKIPYTLSLKKSQKIPKNPRKIPKNPQKIPIIMKNPKSRTPFFRVIHPSGGVKGRLSPHVIKIMPTSASLP